MKYIAIVTSDTNGQREYTIDYRNVIKAAYEFGRADSGEHVTITDDKHNVLSEAMWDPESKKYIRIDPIINEHVTTADTVIECHDGSILNIYPTLADAAYNINQNAANEDTSIADWLGCEDPAYTGIYTGKAGFAALEGDPADKVEEYYGDQVNLSAIEKTAKEETQARRFAHLLAVKQIPSRNMLSMIANVPQRTINDLCSGKAEYSTCRHITLKSIADSLGMSIDQLDAVIEDGAEPEKRWIVEAVMLNKDGTIRYGMDRLGFGTLEEAQEYYNSRQAKKGYGWVLYELGTVVDQKGIN